MRELVFSTKNSKGSTNSNLKEGLSLPSTLMEKLYLANLTAYNQPLNLSEFTNLKVLDAYNSAFTSITLPSRAPMESIILSAPTTLSMSNLSTVQEFEITNYNALSTLVIDNVD
jgi:hypothetical protein